MSELRELIVLRKEHYIWLSSVSINCHLEYHLLVDFWYFRLILSPMTSLVVSAILRISYMQCYDIDMLIGIFTSICSIELIYNLAWIKSYRGSSWIGRTIRQIYITNFTIFAYLNYKYLLKPKLHLPETCSVLKVLYIFNGFVILGNVH